jgi:hypothetical protein
MSKRPDSAAASAPGKQQSYVRLHGRWPRVMQAIWVALAAFLLYAFVTTLPRVATQMRTPCQPGSCPWLQYTTPQIAAISHQILPYETYISVILALGTASLVAAWSVSAVIIWRRPDDWMAALVAYALLFQGSFVTTTSVPLGATPWLNPNTYALTVFQLIPLLVFALFPNGRFAPRWTRWVIIVGLMLIIPVSITGILPKTIFYTSLGPLGFVVTLIESLALVIAQIYRYRAVSTPLERQQTKWALVGLAAPEALFVAFLVGASLAAALGAPTGIVTLLSSTGGFGLPFGLAIGFGFAMMRSRLWEIDVIIRRTLIYGTLAALLALIYFGGVIGLQALVQTLSGAKALPSIAVVATTLVIAALFNPLRQWLQALIDRRFYRGKYDAARTLAAFGAALRTETNLKELSDELLEVVQDTMHPARVSLWLRPSTARGAAEEEG